MTASPRERDTRTAPAAGNSQRQMALLSHDLRSALAGIVGGLRLLDSERLAPQDRVQLSRVTAESHLLSELMDIAFHLDEPAAPASRGAEASCNFEQFLREQSAKWEAQAEEKSILWNLRIKSLPRSRINVGSLRLSRAIGNVVNNAIKYTDAGGVDVTVATTANGAVEVVVTDNGPGFSDEALAKAFDYFGRPENSAKPGTGLGLHISKTLLDQVGAGISLHNSPGAGAQAIIVFPSALFTAENIAAEEFAPTLPDLTGIRILLAEDNKTNQMVATQMLQTMHAEVTVASDGYEALLKFEKGNFDLALLDIEMPRMSGLDVLRAIRARTDARANTPLVALTAYAMREHKERISPAGANGLIPKPLISIESFGRALLDYLGIEPKPALQASQQSANNETSGDTIDTQIYQSLRETIGAESMGELLEKVVEDIRSVKEGLISGERDEDLQVIRSSTHILISVAGAIGATSLQSSAERLNAAANANNDMAIAQLSAECISGIALAEDFLAREQEQFRRAL